MNRTRLADFVAVGAFVGVFVAGVGLLAVDVSDLPDGAVKRGDMVTLIGDGISIDDLAAKAGTIGYEVLTSLGRRYHRVYRVS